MTKQTQSKTTHGDDGGWETLYIRDKKIPEGLPVARRTASPPCDEVPRSTVREPNPEPDQRDRSG